MCGIAGLVNFNKNITLDERLEIETVCKALRHRGPDAQMVKDAGQRCVLGGVRLRMTDAQNPESDLPLLYDNRYVIVFNGEIYNHVEIRKQLPDINWRTQSDTETLVAAYAQWGEECLSHFEGMFAFAIYDLDEKSLFCARDMTGQKPFYYMCDHNRFAFASEINAMLEGFDYSFDFCPQGVANFIANRMILGAHTHIKDLKKLEPGCSLRVNAVGKTEHKRFYKLPIVTLQNSDAQKACTDIKDAVISSCQQTFNIEHPPALLLSGGIDSSGVLAVMKDMGLKPQTYSIGFGAFEGENFGIDSVFNEFDASRYMAEHFDTTHHEIEITPDEYLEAIGQWVSVVDEPLDATDAPLLYLLFQRISKDGYRLVYSGSGPDEVFDGYGHGAALMDVERSNLADAYCDRFSWNFGVEYERLMPAYYQKARQDIKYYFDDVLRLYEEEVLDNLQATQLLNFHGRLSAYEFKQVDLTSMHFGIEVRSPLVDKRVLKAAFDFDPALKAKNGEEKWIYKQAWKDMLPTQIVERKKIGFPTPMEFWFTDSFKRCVSEALGQGALIRTLGILDDEYLDSLIAAESPELRALSYRLYCLECVLQNQQELMNKNICKTTEGAALPLAKAV